jgi:hypothetical protein
VYNNIDLTDLQGYFGAADEHHGAVVLAAWEEWEMADDFKAQPRQMSHSTQNV